MRVVTRRRSLPVVLGWLALACASVPAAEGPIDWQAVAAHWSVHVVTRDPDGDERVTRVWIALYRDGGAIRTNHTRWLANLQRDRDLRLRVDGLDHPVRAGFVDDPAVVEAIDRAFLAKYGWQEHLLMGDQGRDAHAFFLLLVPRGWAAPPSHRKRGQVSSASPTNMASWRPLKSPS